MAFANNINTHEGGTHLDGFKQALTRVVNNYARSKGILKEKDSNLSGDDCREGLSAIISVKLHDPQFRGRPGGRGRLVSGGLLSRDGCCGEGTQDGFASGRQSGCGAAGADSSG